VKQQNKDFSKYLLRRIEHEGEYFTVKKTGRSGMSISGLARFVGKHHPTISYWVKKVKQADSINNDLPEPLKPFAGKPLTLEGYRDPRGRYILEDRFCSAIVEYFAIWSRDAETNSIAKARLTLIRDLGMRLYIHLKTGWYPDCEEEDFNRDAQQEQKLLKSAEIRDQHRVTYSHRRHILKDHGVNLLSQRWITHQDYQILLSMDTKELRAHHNIPKEDLIVDHLDSADQATLSFAHMMQSESLEAKNIHGYYPVKDDCGSVMKKVVDFRASLRSESHKQLPGDSQ
jgi:hypothetical protein